MEKSRRFYIFPFLYGFIISFALVLFTEFYLCNRCVINQFQTQRNNIADWNLVSGIQKVVPKNWKNSSHISSTLDLSGFGNLMFQYAALIGIAQESNLKPVISMECKLNKIFHLDVEKWESPRPGQGWGKVVEHKASAYDHVIGRLYIDDNVELVGYFQSWMYFTNTTDTIRRHFQFHPRIERRVDQFFEIEKFRIFKNSKLENLVHIGVHIRRGDMLRKDRVEYGYTVAGVDYLKKAIGYHERTFSGQSLLYVVCSDDIKWARENFPPTSHHVMYCHGNREFVFVDLAILARCNHSIITTGTFGWWSGWLAGGHVTYYKDYPRNGSRLSRSFTKDKGDYYPPGWVGL